MPDAKMLMEYGVPAGPKMRQALAAARELVLCGEEAEYCDITDAYQVLEMIEGIYSTSKNKLR